MPNSGTTTVTISQKMIAAKANQRQPCSGSGCVFSPCHAPRRSVRLAQQQALHEDQWRGDRNDHDDDHGHEVVGRHAELVGELVEIGREHQHVLRVAQHQRQAEQFEAEEEHQHAGEQNRRQDHRQADIDRDLERIGAGNARGFLQIGAKPAQRGGAVKIDVRHMGEAGDHDQREQRIQIPRHEAEHVLGQSRKNADRADGDDVAEGDHHRRDENRDQQQGSRYRLPGTSVRTIKKASKAPSGTAIVTMPVQIDQRGPERLPEVVIGEDEGISRESRSSPSGRRTARSGSSGRRPATAASPRQSW